MRCLALLATLLLAACAAPAPPEAPAETTRGDLASAVRTGRVAIIRPLGGAAAEVVLRDDGGRVIAVVLRDAAGLAVGDRVRLEQGLLRPAP